MTTLHAAEHKAIGPDDIYPSGKYATLLREQENGIGAQDGDIIDMAHVTDWTPDEKAPFYEAGELYAEAIRGANEMRHRAFAHNADNGLPPEWDKMLAATYMHAQPTVPGGSVVYTIERERGIPAW